MTTRPHPDTPVTSDAELAEHWRRLLRLDGPPAGRTLFLSWLRADGTSVPLLVPIEELPVEPDRTALAHLLELHDTVAGSEGVDPAALHLAMCLERHGPAGLSPDDHAWCSAVEAVLRDRGGLDCSVHVTDGRTAVPVLARSRWP